MKSATLLWSLAGILFLALAGVAVYKVMPLLNPEVIATAPLDTSCDLRAGPCVSTLSDGQKISFAIRPESLPMIEPLELEVKIEGMEARGVEVDFVGISMNMGFNRPKLSPTGQGSFQGKGMLPVCVRDAMEWEARVLVESSEGLIAAPYRFITVKPGVALPGGEQ